MSHFQKNVTLVLVGALVGLVPTFIQARLQAREQRQQLLFTQEMAALKDLSTALSANGPLFAKDEELQVLLIEDAESDHPEREFDKIEQVTVERELLENEYIGGLHTASLEIAEVFGKKVPTLNYPEVPPPPAELKRMNRKDLTKLYKKDLSELEQHYRAEHKNELAFIQEYEKFIENVGLKMNKFSQ